jgi:hypothetical protein
MMATQVFAYGDIQNVSYSDNIPQSYLSDHSGIRSTIDFNSSSSSQESHPWYVDASNRELVSFDIFRDDTFIANVGADVFSYRDEPLENMIEYCYALRSNYDEGVSEFSDLVCETPNPGPPASNLVTSDLQGTIGLDWTAAPSGDVLDYSIYKDGEPFASTTDTSYEDVSDIIAGVEYCYDVRARYVSGETFPTNTACAIYTLDPPVGTYAEGNDADQNILVTWNEPGSFVLYDVTCDGGSWQGEVTWELEYLSEIVLTGNAPFSQNEVPLFYGDYVLYMHDSFGDGWNGNIFSLYDQNGNLGASCTLDTGTEGTCEFTLGGDLASTGGIPPVIAIDNAPENKAELVALAESNSEAANTNGDIVVEEFTQTVIVHSRDLLGYNLYRDGSLIAEFDNTVFSYIDEDTEHDIIYCYTVKSIYDDGLSIPSNESCHQWTLAPATDFDASGTNGQVELMWNGAESNDVLGNFVFEGGSLLVNTQHHALL